MGFDAADEQVSGSFRPLPGISVIPAFFGNFKKGISPVYWSVADYLESIEYKLIVNAFGAPYDYRYMSVSALTLSPT